MESSRTPEGTLLSLRLGRHSHTFPAPPALKGGLLTRVLDVLREGIVFLDLEERPVYANATLLRILTQQPDAEDIRREIRRFAESLASLARHSHAPADALEELAVRDFRTPEGSYLLRGSLVRAEAEGRDGLLMVGLEPASAEFLSAEIPQSRYNLTSREVRVACLVTLGLSDAEIAAHLCISLHTARHHTEHLRQKLGVRSRGEVAAHVLRVGRGAAGGATRTRSASGSGRDPAARP